MNTTTPPFQRSALIIEVMQWLHETGQTARTDYRGGYTVHWVRPMLIHGGRRYLRPVR